MKTFLNVKDKIIVIYVKTKQTLYYKMLTCCYCDQEFDNQEVLDCHIKNHLHDNTSECAYCKELIPENSLSEHIAQKHDFKCEKCSDHAKFTTKIALQDHVFKKHKEKAKRKPRRLLKDHAFKKHKEKAKHKPQPKKCMSCIEACSLFCLTAEKWLELEWSASPADPLTLHVIGMCDSVQKAQPQEVEPQEVEPQEVQLQGPRGVLPQRFPPQGVYPQRIQPQEVRKCPVCLEEIAGNAEYYEHCRGHLPHRPEILEDLVDNPPNLSELPKKLVFNCPECDKKIEAKSEFEAHFKEKHLDVFSVDLKKCKKQDQSVQEIFVCPVCQKKCKTLECFSKHHFDHKIKQLLTILEENEPVVQDIIAKHSVNLPTNDSVDIPPKNSGDNPPSSTIECPECKEKIEGKSAFGKHFQNKHLEMCTEDFNKYKRLEPGPAKEYFVCPTCQRIFQLIAAFNKHLLAHKHVELSRALESPVEIVYDCPDCPEKIQGKSEFESHFKKRHIICTKWAKLDPSNKKVFECPICHRWFKNGFFPHMIGHKLDQLKDVIENQKPIEDIPPSTMDNTSISMDKPPTSEDNPPILEDSSPSSSDNPPEKEPPTKLIKLQCGMPARPLKFPKPPELPKIVTKPMPKLDVFDCPICERKFESKSLFSQHFVEGCVRWKHRCDLCSKKCGSKLKLEEHMQKCGSEQNSEEHMLIVRGKGKTTSYKGFMLPVLEDTKEPEPAMETSQVVQNVTVYAEMVPVFIFSCQDCSEQFIAQSDLDEHVKIHSAKSLPFQCKVCKIFLPSKSSYDQHWNLKHNFF